MNKLLGSFLTRIQTAGQFTNYEIALLRYGIVSTCSEFAKLLLYFFFFTYFGMASEFLFATIVLISFRCFTGGIHFEHFISCLIVSFLFYILVFTLSAEVLLAFPVQVVLVLLCGVAIYFCAPVISDKRPVYSPDKLLRFRNIALILILAYLPVLFILKNTPFALIGTWTIIIQTLQLIVAKMKGRCSTYVKLFKNSAC